MEYLKVSEPLVGEAEIEAVAEVLRSGMYVSGKRVAQFEARFAQYVGVDHAVAVNSGTAALHLALLALGLRPRDEVIVPSMTFFATATAVFHAGGRPVFADIDDDFCLDPTSVREQITERTRGIIPVHLFGYAPQLDELREIADEQGLFVLEDCAQGLGTTYRGQVAGSLGHAGAFSFFATKNMTTGEGGMVTTNDPDAAKLMRALRSHGMEGRDEHVVLGYNYRMTEMEAAMGMVQLAKLDAFNRKRRSNSLYLYERLEGLPWVGIQQLPSHIEHSFFWCPIFVREEVIGMSTAAVRAKLHDMGIGTRQRYQEPLYRQPMLRADARLGESYEHECPFRGGLVPYHELHFPNAEKYAGRLLGLPNHPGLTREQLDRIADSLRSL